MDSLSTFKQKQQKEIQQALQYERQRRARELQKSQLVLKSCERMQMITDRQLEKLKQSQISVVKHQTHEQRFKSLESDNVHIRPKNELDQEAYERWISMQKSLLKRVETQKLKKFESKIDRAERIRQMKEQELKNKQKIRIEADLQKLNIHSEYTHRLIVRQFIIILIEVVKERVCKISSSVKMKIINPLINIIYKLLVNICIMDPLAKLKQKQQRELQHLLEYERKLRDKEIKSSQLLLKKKEKLHEISLKQLKLKEDLQYKAEQRKNEFEKNLSQAKLFEQEQLKHHKSHVEKTVETLEKFQSEYKKEQNDFLTKKMSEHNHQIEQVLTTKQKLDKMKLKELSQSLDEKFKQSEDVRFYQIFKVKQQMSKQLSDRQKSEQQKLESYFKQVEQQQKKLEQYRNKKGEQFDEKIDKVEKLKQEKEKELKERQKLRIEAEKQKEMLTKEFMDDLVKMQKQNFRKQFQI